MTPQPVSSQAVQQAILQALYALFLGGMITAFLVVGLNTFYPPSSVHEEEIAALYEQESQIHMGGDISPEEFAELEHIQQQLQTLLQEQQAAEQAWLQTAGLVFIGLATALLALSMIRLDRAIVLSNGLLLGGLFTMVGGIGLTIASGEGMSRFLVLSLALAITVGLGYLRFARGTDRQPAAGQAPVDDAGLTSRVVALESRLDEMRRALGG